MDAVELGLLYAAFGAEGVGSKSLQGVAARGTGGMEMAFVQWVERTAALGSGEMERGRSSLGRIAATHLLLWADAVQPVWV